jgi:RNase P protein component
LQPGTDIVVIVRAGADKLSFEHAESELGSILLGDAGGKLD